MKKVLLCWSTGKDSAWTLNVLRQHPEYSVVGLVTTITKDYQRVSMHGVREGLAEIQAESAGLPLWKVMIPADCSNDRYEQEMGKVIEGARRQNITVMAFGDLFLEDIRSYRCKKLAGTGIEPIFPLWKIPTRDLAKTMLSGGLRAKITCVDTKQIDPKYSGLEFSEEFLDALPDGADPCGENGEFHTFCSQGPMFSEPIPIKVGERTIREGFCFTDVTLEKRPAEERQRSAENSSTDHTHSMTV